MNDEQKHNHYSAGTQSTGASKPAASGPSGMAAEAMNTATQAASETITHLGDHLKNVLNHQVSNGAQMVGHFAGSMRIAAEELDRDAPQMGRFVRLAADKADGWADHLHGQSANDLFRTASDLTKRQPALVFGAAALAGFFALRLFKSATVPSPSIQPGQGSGPSRAGEFHGV